MENKYYVYQHTRLDTNEIFYIGVGTKQKLGKSKSSYKRAYDKTKSKARTNHWLNIINLTEYGVDIVFESNIYQDVLNKEKELISYYGKRCNNTGTLVNLSDGGLGSTGYKFSDEQKTIMKEHSHMRGKSGYKHFASKEVFVYNTNGDYINTFGSYNLCATALNIDCSSIDQVLSGLVKQCKGFVFYANYKGIKIEPMLEFGRNYNKIRKVIALDSNLNEIKKFKSVSDSDIYVKTSTSNISKACKNKKSLIKKYYWRYEKNI